MSTSAFVGFVDDAAIFPPGNAPLSRAVEAHRQHRAAWYADVVGPFLCSDARLPELHRLVERADAGAEITLGIVVRGGAGAVQPALAWAQRCTDLRAVTVEVALRDEPQLARNARRVTTVLDDCPEDLTAYVEMPRPVDPRAPSAGWLEALDEIAAAGHRTKYRTGGPTMDDHPGEHELAAFVAACLDREIAFKCTAGLHHAIRNTAPRSGFEQHGYLNVLLATRASLDGGSLDDVADVLARRDAGEVATAIRELDETTLTATRRWFTSFGSCSVSEPVDDLLDLGLLERKQ